MAAAAERRALGGARVMLARSYQSAWFPVVAIGGLTTIWLFHVVLTELGDPLGSALDIVLWLAGSGFKIATIAALPALLGAAYSSIAGNFRAATAALLIWVSLGSVTIIALALTRDAWAPLVTNSAIHYYSLSPASDTPPLVQEHRDAWAAAWQRGVVQGSELGLGALLAIVHAAVGLLAGRRPVRGVVLGYLLTIAILVSYSLTFGWHIPDYDQFHGDIFSGAILYDSVFFFVAIDPYTTLSIPFYLGCLLSSAAICGCSASAAQQGR